MDVLCSKCGEPWNSYGLLHGDVRAWESALIRAGAGCPSCLGQKSRSLKLSELLSNDDALEGNYAPKEVEPEYKKPEPHKAFECEDCGKLGLIDQDEIWLDGLRLYTWTNDSEKVFLDEIKKHKQHYGFKKINGKTLCNECARDYSKCNECGKFVGSKDSVCHEMRTICMDCYETEFSSCNQCGQVYNIDETTFASVNGQSYCEHCFEKCEVCGEYFDKNNIISGPDDETCCSESCADKVAQKE